MCDHFWKWVDTLSDHSPKFVSAFRALQYDFECFGGRDNTKHKCVTDGSRRGRSKTQQKSVGRGLVPLDPILRLPLKRGAGPFRGFTVYERCVVCAGYFDCRYDFGRPHLKVVVTTFHWHAHSVWDLCFTTDGAFGILSPSRLPPIHTLPPFFPFTCFSSSPFSPLLFSFFLSSSSSLSSSFCSPFPLPPSSTTPPHPPTSHLPPPGTYLLSGGEESVLVLWQLDTHKRQFRPRLGSPITRVACSPGDKYFTLSLQNNGTHMLCCHGNTCNVHFKL